MTEKKTENSRRRLTASRALIAVVTVAAILCYGFYFRASIFQSKTSDRNATAQTQAKQSTSSRDTRGLAKAFMRSPAQLNDEQYVAAALAWEQQLQQKRKQPKWTPEVREDHFVVFDAMVDEIETGLDEIGPDQPGLSEPMESLLEQAAQDLPID